MVRCRFAPSPTGDVHVGSLRTALYNYLYAKKNNGSFLLRLEDTDRTRLKEGSVDTLLNALYTTGVVPDEGLLFEESVIQEGDKGPYIQSERLPIYQEYIQKLLDSGDAYYCFCSKERLDEVRKEQISNGETPRYDGHCRDLSKEEVQERLNRGDEYVIRLKLPDNTDITFEDQIRGPITVNTNDLDDQVLIKADGFPTYHFAVVVDDHLMNITDIIRGEEWLPSTPKHVYLYDKLGWELPKFYHLPNILNKNRKKLSKREGDVSVESFLEKGYLPEALVNYLALLGWSPDGNQEIFNLNELIENFDLSKVGNTGSIFDIDKLNWVNSQYIKNLTEDELIEKLKPYFVDEEIELTPSIVNLIRERLEYLSQAPEILKEILNSEFEIEDEQMLEIINEPSVPILYEALLDKIGQVEELDAATAQGILKEIQKEHKAEKIKGKMLYMPTRILITGQMHGPDLSLIMEVLGKEEVLRRLSKFENRFRGK